MDPEGTRRCIWRPSFDEVKGNGFLCFRARAKPVQPLKQQFCYEIKQLFSHPCDFTRGSETWRETFAVSSVRCIPATVLFVSRLVCLAAQSTLISFSLSRGAGKLYFLTTWTNLLLTVHFMGLSLCSAVALLVKPKTVNQRLTAENMHLRGSAGNESLPVLLRLVECVSSLSVGASFVTCVVYWSALHYKEKARSWMAYCDHVCFIPVFLMALISRIPYRLQRIWLVTLFAVAYCVLCIIVAFVPLTTWRGRVGYVYNALQYQTEPVQAWVLTGLLTSVVPPISYVLFWFFLRFNNPQP